MDDRRGKLLDQLREIRDDDGVTILMITHNIALVAEVADRVAVMYAGQMVEIGSVVDVFDNPLHPYTQGLLRSVPNISLDEDAPLYKMAGEPPNLTRPPTGCRFHPRCRRPLPPVASESTLIDAGRGTGPLPQLHERAPDRPSGYWGGGS